MINSQQTRCSSTGMITYGRNVYVRLGGCRALMGTLSFLFFILKAFKQYKMLKCLFNTFYNRLRENCTEIVHPDQLTEIVKAQGA